MSFRNSILKVVAWTIIGLWISRWLIFRLVNIDFSTIEIARTFRHVWILLIPIAIAILIYKSWNQKTTKTKKVFSLTLGILVSAGLIVFLNFFSSFCEWQFDYVRYEHKTKNMKIQNRFFDCGATTSGEPYELVITQPLGQFLIKYEPIEESQIDLTKWKKK
jgi:HD-like signal output (HDOD) protein